MCPPNLSLGYFYHSLIISDPDCDIEIADFMKTEMALAQRYISIAANYTLAGTYLLFSAAAFVLFLIWYHSRSSLRINLPAPGCKFPIVGPWLEAFRFIFSSVGVIEDGVKECGPGTTFKISTPTRWLVVTTNEDLIKQLGNADERMLSMQAAADERNAISYILSNAIHGNPFHVGIINKHLGLYLGEVLPFIEEEIKTNIWELTHSIGTEWTGIDNFHEFLLKCVSDSTNRILVGPRLCRDQQYIQCLTDLSARIARAGQFCNLAPPFLRPIISNILVHRSDSFRKFMGLVGSEFERRRKYLVDGYADHAEKPNDAVQWILESAPSYTPTYELCARILYIAFSAIHTSSISITHALYDLAGHPEYQESIREEIENVLKSTDGWTKQALSRMKRLDSSLKESQRMHPVTIATMMRKALNPVTLSDGTALPKGQWVVVAAYAMNHSDKVYSNPTTFDALRFASLGESISPFQNEKTRAQGLAYGNLGYLSFGIGRHACPGRYFTAAELKMLLGYILCNFDVKLSGPPRPNKFFSFLCLPDYETKLLMKRREEQFC